MAYDEALASRLRELLRNEDGLTEKRIFGGLAFLINGNMAVAASGEGGLLVRCDPHDTDRFVREHAHRMVMRGRAMDGWLRVTDTAVSGQRDLARWALRGVAYARSLAPKER